LKEGGVVPGGAIGEVKLLNAGDGLQLIHQGETGGRPEVKAEVLSNALHPGDGSGALVAEHDAIALAG
jgi:hypothetical protein